MTPAAMVSARRWCLLVLVVLLSLGAADDHLDLNLSPRSQLFPARTHSAADHPECETKLTKSQGVIQTPNFPGPFKVPFRCRWVIDNESNYTQNSTIIVYLTQLYVTQGLSFTEYLIYSRNDPSMTFKGALIHTVTDRNATRTSWIHSNSSYLVIDFVLDRLEGNHIRVMDQFLDVYGFNITYEITTRPEPVRETCNLVTCSLVGNCYAAADYSRFECACLPGFSGKHCGMGPLCKPERHICQNGANCRHVGSLQFLCDCPKGFSGSSCEQPPAFVKEIDCDEESCGSQCPFVSGKTAPCNCGKGPKIPADRVQIQGTVRLANLSSRVENLHQTGPRIGAIANIVERQIAKLLRNSSLTKLDPKVVNVTSSGEATFHFFVIRTDVSKVIQALNRMVESKHIGNLNLASSNLIYRQISSLMLKRLEVNLHDREMREGDEFTISCVAQGSPSLRFYWFKDGKPVNETKSIRRIFTSQLPADHEDQRGSSLTIGKATLLDSGLYTCQAVDWGFQQCRSIRLQVITPPELSLSPMVVTVEKGSNVNIRCVIRKNPRNEKFGFNWAKAGALFKMAPGIEVWEDLYPSGSILKVINAQRTVNYTCTAMGPESTRTVQVHVEVVNRTVVPLCPVIPAAAVDELQDGVAWPETAPGLEALQPCPYGYIGLARRHCTIREHLRPHWTRPADLSACVAHAVKSIRTEFERLTLGYETTTGGTILSQLLSFLVKRDEENRPFYPGEGEPILDLVYAVRTYLKSTGAHEEARESSEDTFRIISHLLNHERAFINYQRVSDLQRLVQTQAVWWAQLTAREAAAVSPPAHISHHLALYTLWISVDAVLLSGFHLLPMNFPLVNGNHPSWFSDKPSIRLESQFTRDSSREMLESNFGADTVTVAVVAYRNLSKFLPLRYVAKLPSGEEYEYEIHSRLISISVVSSPKSSFNVTTTLILETSPLVSSSQYGPEWTLRCAVASFSGPNSKISSDDNPWDLDACRTERITPNLSSAGKMMDGASSSFLSDSTNISIRCTCPRTGTYAVMLTTAPDPGGGPGGGPPPGQYAVLLGCGCCLLQSLLTLCLLIPYWWTHRSCLTFLKLQCCTATSGAMSVFIYAVRDTVPKATFSYVTSGLGAFLLIGMSSHLSKLLVIYTETVQVSGHARQARQMVITIITGVPILAVLCNHLAHLSTGWRLTSWWILYGTLFFNIFVICAALITVLFVFMYIVVTRRLSTLAGGKGIECSKAITRRMGLIRRAALLFISMLIVETASILYINLPSSIYQYIFSLASALLGFITFLSYAIKSESPVHMRMLKKFKLESDATEVSSESNSPLRFFTKQDGDAESESAPPPRREVRGIAVGEAHSEAISEETAASPITETLLLTDSRPFLPTSEGQLSTVETYVEGTSIDGKSPSLSTDYLDMTCKVRPEPATCFIRDSVSTTPVTPPQLTTTSFINGFPQEIVTARVCVELGLVTQSTRTPPSESTPAIVLCSVDVEPLSPPMIITAEDTPSPATTTDTTTTVQDESGSEETEQQRRQPEGQEESDDQMEGMMDRISHDLDYLLNRSTPLGGTSVHHSRKVSKSVRCGRIQEEEEPLTTSPINHPSTPSTSNKDHSSVTV